MRDLTDVMRDFEPLDAESARLILRDRVHWATLNPAEDSGQAGRRPVIVLSRNAIHQVLPILAVVPVTSFRRSGRVYPTEVLLPAGTAGLPRASLALGHEVRTVSASRLQGHLGVIVEADVQSQILSPLSPASLKSHHPS